MAVGKTNAAGKSTKDATATAADVFVGKTVYVNNAKITGTALATTSTGVAADLTSGKLLYDSNGNLVTGTSTAKKIASGTFVGANEHSKTISGLPFTPSIVVIFRVTAGFSNEAAMEAALKTPTVNVLSMGMVGSTVSGNYTTISDTSFTSGDNGKNNWYWWTGMTYEWYAIE